MLRKNLFILAVAALLALIANGWVSDQATRVTSHATRWVEHSYQVLEAVAQFRSSVAEAETAARGFAITGNSAFKADFEQSKIGTREVLQRLRRLSKDNPHQTAALNSVEPVLADRLNLLSGLIELKERNAAEPNVQMTVLNGALLTRSMRTALLDIRTEELRLLTERQVDSARARRWAIWGPWLMVSIALVMFLSLIGQVLLTLKSEAAARAQLESAVRDEQSARRHAEEADRLKDEFLATLSHELRTPLTSMVGWSSLLQDPERAPELLQQGIRSISEAARAQTRLIEDLLDISRIMSGKLHITLGPVNLTNVVEEAIAAVLPSAQAKGVALRRVLDSGVDGVVGDAARLQQVVWNLLTNAVKFTPRGGHVDVLLRQAESHIEISVADDGEGIDAAFLPHVFDRFRQADSTATRRAGGLGLGLSLAKNLVEAHGGAIRALSAGRNKGSKFVIELPILGTRHDVIYGQAWQPQPDPGTSQTVAAPAQQPAVLASRTILVIDDDSRTLQIVKTMLEQAGAQVMTATNTREAIGALETAEVDLIVCDIGMPEEDGLTFIGRLRTMMTRYANVPAIALTAFARADDRVTALSAGFNAYLSKPVTREELVLASASLLRILPDRRRPKLEADAS